MVLERQAETIGKQFRFFNTLPSSIITKNIVDYFCAVELIDESSDKLDRLTLSIIRYLLDDQGILKSILM